MSGPFAVLVVLPALAGVPVLRRVVIATGPAEPDDPPPRHAVPSVAALGLATAAVLAPLAVALRHHPWWLPAYAYLGAVGVALTVTDLRVHRLPDLLTLPSYPVLAALFGLAAAIDPGSAGGPRRWLSTAAAGVAVWLVFIALWSLPGQGLGYGDVKLSGLLGAALGWLGWSWVFGGLAAGMLLAGLAAAGLLASGRASRQTRFAYGPFLLAGAFVAILAAHPG